MTHQTKLLTKSPVLQIVREFPYADQKGRRIGASVWTYSVVYVPHQPALYESCATIAPGTYFCFRPSAMRGSECYGAIQRVQHFTTEGERDKAVARYFEGAGKRAAKNPKFTVREGAK